MKKLLAIMLTFVLCFSVLSFAFAAENETAVPDGYTGIYTAEDLDNIRNNLSGKYILMNDIDLSSYGNWNPIGTSEAPFTGELDGNGYAMKNMTIVLISENYVFAGLFGAIKKASINKVEIKNAEINITSTESVYSGIICGDAKESEFSDCTVSGSLAVKTEAYAYAGGISGVLSCEFTGNGEKCENNANIEVILTGNEEASAYIGGVFGVLAGNIEKSCNNGNITVNSSLRNKVKKINLGGIAGWSINGTVNNCYNAGNITEKTNQTPVIGGISGHSFTVTNCYNYGGFSLTSTEGIFGGITGETELYNSFLPAVTEPKNKLENCYYLNNIPSATTFLHEEQMINVKSLTAEEFKNKESFVGFDFENVWRMDEELGRPIFKIEQEEPSTEQTSESTSVKVTEPTTTETTVTVTETTTKEVETTQLTTEPLTTEAATTQPVTEENTEPTTEESTTLPATETTTEPATDPGDTGDEPCWIVRILKKIIDFFSWIFSVLGC